MKKLWSEKAFRPGALAGRSSLQVSFTALQKALCLVQSAFWHGSPQYHAWRQAPQVDRARTHSAAPHAALHILHASLQRSMRTQPHSASARRRGEVSARAWAELAVRTCGSVLTVSSDKDDTTARIAHAWQARTISRVENPPRLHTRFFSRRWGRGTGSSRNLAMRSRCSSSNDAACSSPARVPSLNAGLTSATSLSAYRTASSELARVLADLIGARRCAAPHEPARSQPSEERAVVTSRFEKLCNS
jgi:hypothetical protein